MGVYNWLVQGYYQFLAMFPEQMQWLVSLVVLVAFVWLFVVLVAGNALFLILLALFLPVVIPILLRLLTDFYQFFWFLLHQLGIGT